MEKKLIIKIRPWQAAVIIPVLIAIFFSLGYYRFIKASERSKKGADEIIAMIKAGKGQMMVKDIRNLDPYKPEDRKALQVAVKHHVNEFNIELVSYEMRGSWMGDMVFRLEYKADGSYPDGEKFHYYRIPYSLVTGWDVTEMHYTDANYYNSAIWRKQDPQQ